MVIFGKEKFCAKGNKSSFKQKQRETMFKLAAAITTSTAGFVRPLGQTMALSTTSARNFDLFGSFLSVFQKKKG